MLVLDPLAAAADLAPVRRADGAPAFHPGADARLALPVAPAGSPSDHRAVFAAFARRLAARLPVRSYEARP